MISTIYTVFIGELATSVKNRTDIHFGVYFSHFEWFHPLYLKDKAAKFQTQEYIKVCGMTTKNNYNIVMK